MTRDQIEYAESQILQAALSARKAVRASKLRIFVIGQQLESLGRALQNHPEEVTPTPEPVSIYDYKDGLNALDRAKVVSMCNELRNLEIQAKAAEQRVTGLLQSVQNWTPE
jgi:hypothetical protein